MAESQNLVMVQCIVCLAAGISGQQWLLLIGMTRNKTLPYVTVNSTTYIDKTTKPRASNPRLCVCV